MDNLGEIQKGDGGGIERERKETRIEGGEKPDKKLPVSRLLHHPKENGLWKGVNRFSRLKHLRQDLNR